MHQKRSVWAGERDEGREGRKEWEEEGTKREEEGEEKEWENLAPTVISKSRRLWNIHSIPA